MTIQTGDSIAVNTRINRKSYNELKSYLNEHNNTISAVASQAIEYGLKVMRQIPTAIDNVVNENKPGE